jgi:hypothetical protein
VKREDLDIANNNYYNDYKLINISLIINFIYFHRMKNNTSQGIEIIDC